MATSSKSTPAPPVLDPFQVATSSVAPTANGKLISSSISLFVILFVSIKFQIIVCLVSRREISEKICCGVLLVLFF